MTKTWMALAAAALSVAMSACVRDDLGAPCVLVRADPTDTDSSDGTRSIPIKESEIQGSDSTDIISFGATECENLVCVRPAGTPDTDPGVDNDATGICSRPCAVNEASSCETGNSGIDQTSPFTCRGLVLDEAALVEIQNRYPDLIPPNVVSPFYCAKPMVVSTN